MPYSRSVCPAMLDPPEYESFYVHFWTFLDLHRHEFPVVLRPLLHHTGLGTSALSLLSLSSLSLSRLSLSVGTNTQTRSWKTALPILLSGARMCLQAPDLMASGLIICNYLGCRGRGGSGGDRRGDYRPPARRGPLYQSSQVAPTPPSPLSRPLSHSLSHTRSRSVSCTKALFATSTVR